MYAAPVKFDKPGLWQVAVTVDIANDRRRRATAAFPVLDRHKVPAPGEAALASENLTVASAGVSKAAVDSRAGSNGDVPDPELHRTTIADSIRRHRPVVAVFATPVFCISRFCGPVTDMVDELAKSYGDRADFVHIEIWRDYEKQDINQTAQDWLLRDDDLNEPWVFLIGADGRVSARWDNVSTKAEIEPLLQALPRLASGG